MDVFVEEDIKVRPCHKEERQELTYKTVKRIMDVFLATLGLLSAIPIIALLGICIKLESKGVCFYRQQRVGEGGEPFTIYKLRSMFSDAEENGPQWAEDQDTRITKVGRFIRRTRLDEVPQFYNILKGDMSIVGPRPEREYFISIFCQEIPEYIQRLQVKPGLTGWAQVNGGYGLTPKEKLEKDLYYIQNQSLRLDLIIILKTIRVILTGNGAR